MIEDIRVREVKVQSPSPKYNYSTQIITVVDQETVNSQ